MEKYERQRIKEKKNVVDMKKITNEDIEIKEEIDVERNHYKRKEIL